MYGRPETDDTYYEFHTVPQFGYYLTRNVAVGGEYVYMRGGRERWPDSVYHFAAVYLDYTALFVNNRIGFSIKSLAGVGNYCSCAKAVLSSGDGYRTDWLLYYWGYDFTGLIKIAGRVYATASVHHLIPINHRAPYRYGSIGGFVGLRWQIP
jgi:hypothetical protein